MKTITDSLTERENMARQELREWATDNPDDGDPGDQIHEIADGATPVYNGELLDIAAMHNAIALSVPECGPAFSGEATPINIIAANVYEHIEAALWDEWRDIETEREDAENAVEG